MRNPSLRTVERTGLNFPKILQGESLTRLLQGIALGAAATIVVGFYWGGWVLGSTAKTLAAKQVESAQVAILAPLCAQKFAARSDAEVKKIAIAKMDSWKRNDELPKEWTTIPGESSQSSDLAEACLKLIFKAPATAAK